MKPEFVLDTGGYHRVAKGRYGFVMYNRFDTYIGRSIENYGEFSEHEVALFRQILRVGDNVIEVGSNYGTHTLPLAKIVGPNGFVHAIEAQRIVHQALCATISLNNLGNVACHQVAAAAAAGHFFIPQFSYAEEQNYGGLEIDHEVSGERVSAVKLDDLVTVPALRLIKIDAEGMEQQQVIKGAVRLIERNRPILYVENDRAVKSPALIRAIAALEYRLYWHHPPMFNPNNFAGNSENIFGETCSINMLCLPRETQFAMDEFDEILDYDAHPLITSVSPTPNDRSLSGLL